MDIAGNTISHYLLPLFICVMGFRKQAGANSFSLTPERWIETTNAIGLLVKTGK